MCIFKVLMFINSLDVSGIHENDIHNEYHLSVYIPDTTQGGVMLYMACIDMKP